MNKTIFKRIIAGVMLTAFCLSHFSVLSAVAVQNIDPIEDYVIRNTTVDSKPAIRETDRSVAMKLKGEI